MISAINSIVNIREFVEFDISLRLYVYIFHQLHQPCFTSSKKSKYILKRTEIEIIRHDKPSRTAVFTLLGDLPQVGSQPKFQFRHKKLFDQKIPQIFNTTWEISGVIECVFFNVTMYIPCMQSLFLVEVNVSSETHVGKTPRLGKIGSGGQWHHKKGVPIGVVKFTSQKSCKI